MQESNVTTYRKEFSSEIPSSVKTLVRSVRITVEVIDIPDEQHKVVRDSLNEFCDKVFQAIQ